MIGQAGVGVNQLAMAAANDLEVEHVVEIRQPLAMVRFGIVPAAQIAVDPFPTNGRGILKNSLFFTNGGAHDAFTKCRAKRQNALTLRRASCGFVNDWASFLKT